MGRFQVSTPELDGAAVTLGAVDGELQRLTETVGDLGSPELEGALRNLYDGADRVSVFMMEAIHAAAQKLAAAADGYEETDASAFPIVGPLLGAAADAVKSAATAGATAAGDTAGGAPSRKG